MNTNIQCHREEGGGGLKDKIRKKNKMQFLHGNYLEKWYKLKEMNLMQIQLTFEIKNDIKIDKCCTKQCFKNILIMYT